VSPPIELVVVGAHLTGEPLNGQLTGLGGELAGPVRTASSYRLFALLTEPPRPGLVRVGSGGASIEGERWRLPVEGFGAFVAAVPSPLTIGTLDLDDGTTCLGFLCESVAVDGCPDITSYGGWRSYIAPRVPDR
jgi:allophanate hydrolase